MVDFQSLPRDIAQMYGYGRFKELSEQKLQSYVVSFPGSRLLVPVTKEQFENPPDKYSPLIIRGTVESTRYGRPAVNDMMFQICPENEFPKIGEPRIRMEGEFIIEKNSYGDDLNKKYMLTFKAEDLIITDIVDEDQYNRFPSGVHPVIGTLDFEQSWNKQFSAWVTYCKFCPVGVPKQERAPKKQ